MASRTGHPADADWLRVLAGQIDGEKESRALMIVLQVTLAQAPNAGRFARRLSGSNQTGPDGAGRHEAGEAGE